MIQKLPSEEERNENQDLEKEHIVEPMNDNYSDIAGPSTLPAQLVTHQVSSREKRKRRNRIQQKPQTV